jgi:hypothetical protein
MYQLQNISDSALTSAGGIAGFDFFLPTLPPLETIPAFIQQAKPAGQQLAQLKQFRLRFENGMAAALKGFQKRGTMSKSRVITFDTVSWWKGVMKSPKKVR